MSRSEAAFRSALLRAMEPARAAIHAHPFVRGLMDGTLPRDTFRGYVLQDAVYLRSFARALTLVAGRAPEIAWTVAFAEHAAGAIVVERQLHAGFLADLGVSADDAAETQPSPTTLAYASYLLAAAATAPFEEAVAALVPCYWIYFDVASALAVATSPDALYARWIDAYRSDAFGATVEQVLQIVDVLGGRADEQTRRQMVGRVAIAASYEWMFWDAAWRHEEWPAFTRSEGVVV